MKIKKIFSISVMFITLLVLSSCSYRLVDFTIISTKNAEIGVDRTKGVATEGEKSYVFSQMNLKDAMDRALENAGPQYDLLIDGVVTVQYFWFWYKVKVKGLAVSSTDLKAQLGTKGYKQWCDSHDIFDPDKAEIPNN